MKHISSKRSKALAIPQAVKQAVYDRDGGLCVWCHRPGLPEAHFIPRSKSGLGIEQNILTLCRECHDKFDHGTAWERAKMRAFFHQYLFDHYDEWDEEKLIYRRDI